MRKLILSESITLDGVFEGPAKTDVEPFAHAGWTAPYFDDDIMRYVSGNVSGGGELLLGRVTYEQFRDSWGPASGQIADYMNSVKKYVVSNSLQSADWNNSHLIQGNIAEEIATLKQQPGDTLAVLGSGTLVRTLMENDLIDEFSLLVYPVVFGTGKRLFDDGAKAGLKLTNSQTSRSGVLMLTYVPDRG